MPTAYLVQANRPPYEAAAELLATMAFPGPAEADKRHDAAERLSAYVLRLAHDQSHPGLDLRQAKERHVVLADGPIALGKRLEQRLQAVQQAAAIGAPQIAQHLGAEVRAKGVDRISHRGLVAAGLDLRWYNDRSDFRDRAWRPSLPVLHMAVALQTTLGERPQQQFITDHLTFFLDAALVRRAVALAEPLEAVVRNLWGDQFDPNTQWLFRLVV